MKKILLLLLTACISVTFTACSQNGIEFATEYIQTTLDAQYLNITEGYMEMTESTKEEADQMYNDGIEAEVEYFCSYFEIEYPTETQILELTELYKKTYSKSKYTVQEATKVADGEYRVEVTVEPINIIQLMEDELDAIFEVLDSKYESFDLETLTPEEADELYVAYDLDWGNELIALFGQKLESISYLASETLRIEVYIDSENYYTFEDEELMAIDELMIKYNY